MIIKNNKLIYILNNYSVHSTEHFFHVLNLLEEMADNGIDILLLIEKSDGIPVVKSPKIKVKCIKSSGIGRLIEIYKIIAAAQKKDYHTLFVRISNWAAITAIFRSFFSKLNVYYWHSGTVFEFDNQQPLNIKKIKWYLKTRIPFNFIKKHTTYFVTGPESMKDYYVNIVGVSKEKIKILYNDIDLSRFSIISQKDKNILKEGLGIDLNVKVILFVHNFSPVRKSGIYIGKFLKSFYSESELTNFNFYFIGGGKDRKEIEEQVRYMGLNDKVFFLGSLPNAVVHNYYQIADIFINPTAAEGFPRVLIEGMACGLPIVTTNAGGIKDILGVEQQKYMSDVNDIDCFTNNLIKMAKLSSSDIAKLKSENIEMVKKYSTEKVALMYINTIFNE